MRTLSSVLLAAVFALQHPPDPTPPADKPMVGSRSTQHEAPLTVSHNIGVLFRCSSVVRAFAHGAMGRQIDPSWGGPIELFLVPASAPRLV